MSTAEALLETVERRRLPDPESCRQIRERAGITQTELAEPLGVTGGAVSRWEAGLRTPRGGMASRYADLLWALERRVRS